MTHVLERMPVDAITAEARQVQFGRVVLQLLTLVLYGVGWVAAKVFGALWFATVWAGVAVKQGWADARASADADARDLGVRRTRGSA